MPTGWRGPKGERGPGGLEGAQGAKGEPGAKGDPGQAGAPGASGYEIAEEAVGSVYVPNSNNPNRGLSGLVRADCPTGRVAVGDGADLGTDAGQSGQQRQVTISASMPASGGTAWVVQLLNNSTSFDTSIDLRVYAICASVG